MNHNVKRWVASTVGGLTALLLAATASAQLSKSGGAVTINDRPANSAEAAKANPYPSEVEVKTEDIATLDAFGGQKKSTARKAVVRLNRVSHAYPDDIDIALRAPNAPKAAVIMSDAGGRFSLLSTDLVIDDSLKSDGALTFPALLVEPAIAAGTYSSGAYGPDVPATEFPGGPTAPFGNLRDLVGPTINPVGKWQLFVADDQTVDGGEIAQWTLDLYMSPLIAVKIGSDLTTRELKFKEDNSGTVAVQLKDKDTLADNLVLSASSNNEALVDKDSGYTFSGSGESRQLQITPKPNAFGTATVTVKVSDGVSEDTDTFTLTVEPENDPATIAFSSAQVSTAQGVMSSPIIVTVEDPDNVVTTLTLKALTSSNPDVAGVGNVFFGPIVKDKPEGKPENDYKGTAKVYFTPNGAAIGSTTIALGVTDDPAVDPVPQGKGDVTFTVTGVSYKVYAKTTPVSGNPTAPYPSTLEIKDFPGLIGNMTLALADLNIANPEALDVVLESPKGTKVTVLGQSGGATAVSQARITLDDDAKNTANPPAANPLPDNGPLVTGTYVPNDYDKNNDIPSVGKPTDTALKTFQGEDPNGIWKLYVYENGATPVVALKGGFILNIYPSPKIETVQKQTMDEEAEKLVTLTVTDYDGTIKDNGVTAKSDNEALVVAVAIKDAGTWKVKLTGQKDQSGTTKVKITAEDNSGYKSTSEFEVQVDPVNDAPVLVAIPKQVTIVGEPVRLEIEFSDVETTAAADLSAFKVTADSTNPKLLPNQNIVVTAGSAPNKRLLALYPAGTQPGVADVAVVVEDLGIPPANTDKTRPKTDAKIFTLTVSNRQTPIFENAAALTIPDGTATEPGKTIPAYPSTITVTGLSGKVVDVQITLLGLSHRRPDDLDIMLVSPDQKKVILMSDAGGATSIVGAQLAFRSDLGELPGFVEKVPNAGPITSTIQYVPSDYPSAGDGDLATDTFPNAPAGSNF
ncbi:MAG: hypothetical protein IPM24_11390 [Bryobacterales bacterium]|nr:hypothetical protein [Bryobacterales bacterium]